ncbi:MAG TPA: hypothetical protein VD978_16475 [Azospirillum sp.]|nr:hypothetical protein [Azospirillum sp.]
MPQLPDQAAQIAALASVVNVLLEQAVEKIPNDHPADYERAKRALDSWRDAMKKGDGALLRDAWTALGPLVAGRL